MKSRIIVAAGAGASNTNDQGGPGGNIIGFNSKGNNGKGDTQTSGVSGSVNGTFGLGGGEQSRIKDGLNSNGGGTIFNFWYDMPVLNFFYRDTY